MSCVLTASPRPLTISPFSVKAVCLVILFESEWRSSTLFATRVFDSFARVSEGGLLLPPDITTLTHRDLIVALAARHRLPAVYSFRLFVTAGGLMSYGTNQVEMFGQTASYIDRILRGAKPSDLPVQAPTKYETVLNLKTAKALGLTVPDKLLVAADEVIE
jgi:putative tryptophan/tyrosine transport system substrate-binding protein